MAKRTNRFVHRGEIYYADLSPVIGSEQGGLRPVLIVQNDVGNKHSPTTIVVPITSCLIKNKLPTHVDLNSGEGGLQTASMTLCEQVRVINKTRLLEKIGALAENRMAEINNALRISVGLA